MIPYIQINLPTYELMAVIGLVGSISFLRLRNRSYGYTKQQLIGLCIAAVLGMIVGSRLLYIITAMPGLIKEGLTIASFAEHLFLGGFVFYGGLFGALAGIALYCGRTSLNRQQVLNFVTPGIPLFHMFGRIGCFLTGCCYGIEVPWGISYLGTRRFPVQIAEALLEFCVTVWLLTYEDKVKEVRSYSLVNRYLAMYAVLRFFLEFLRGDEARGFWGALSTSQWISIAILITVGINYLRKKGEGINERCGDK